MADVSCDDPGCNRRHPICIRVNTPEARVLKHALAMVYDYEYGRRQRGEKHSAKRLELAAELYQDLLVELGDSQ